ncbi:similar to Saccharomyces cerevisiae YER098W UBP9 Ubiquitin carboxyl-terminal hydrolase, ubiquitin-specific protease that cleaves ubiquitin-protein fusions [Maudiozyma saulgeensis]|uniref:Ubiquitin carboxyl-terminal hydrolase n=1 Tax=Maudiozyma saulgeensis TaxID=1789683 RepID=A0A1X7QYH1_9SACH|nr:similar to Saccharomyces cerevisiae YER098W UBP9 Ubiquitin carboxyl-terminal hydrolase, ubiquitin-specific protease that cleaves ubiquitin-protein fusions [Kazachstania saulgeensis]
MLKRLVGGGSTTKSKEKELITNKRKNIKKKDDQTNSVNKKLSSHNRSRSNTANTNSSIVNNSKPRILKTSKNVLNEVNSNKHFNGSNIIINQSSNLNENSTENFKTKSSNEKIVNDEGNYTTLPDNGNTVNHHHHHHHHHNTRDSETNSRTVSDIGVTPPRNDTLQETFEEYYEDKNTNTNTNNSKQVNDIEKQLLFPISTDLLPFGDGSNKVFGYENFGNTCYCNSVLQCLYHLDNIRNIILEYPMRDPGIERRRKFKTIGNTPRIFTRESFEPLGSASNNNNNNNSSSNNSSKLSNDENLYNDLETTNDLQDNEMLTSKLKEKDTHKKNSFKHALSKYGSDAVLSNNLLSDAASFSSKKKDDKQQSNHIKSGPVHTVIMSSDSMTERLHDGYKTIIVGRKDKNDKNFDKIRKSVKSRSAPTSPTLSSNKRIDLVPLNKDQNLSYSIEQRKKAALIRGPVLHIDHMINVSAKPNLYNTLKDIFECINENENLTGIVSPTKFVKTLKRENILFNSSMQQDAHEFLNFLLNDLNDYLTYHAANVPSNIKNTIIEQFQGTLSNRSKCLTCDTVTASEEPFLDFPIEIKDSESIDIQEVLRHYHQREILNGSNKFYCNQCYGLQEAERLIGLKKLPTTLAINLKRFKYVEEQNANVKLFNKISYPAKLSVESTFDPEVSKEYELTGVVIHLGSSPQHGHYVSLCKSKVFGWLLFDDETVDSVDESTVLRFTGDSKDQSTAYVLFYQETRSDIYKHSDSSQQTSESPKLRSSDANEPEDNISQLIKYDDLITETKRREKNRLQQQQQQQQQHLMSRENSTNKDKGVEGTVKERTKKNSSSSTKSKRRSKILSFMKS